MNDAVSTTTGGATETVITEVTKDLNYYLAHPGEMPTDPAELEKLMAEDAGGGAAAEETKKSEETKPDEHGAGADKSGGAKPEGVLTKDGKHVIPYSEMERRVEEERSRTGAEGAARRVAEEHATDLQRQLEETQANLAAAKRGEAGKDVTAATEVPKEVMEKIRTEFPSFAALFDAQSALIAQATEKVTKLEGRLTGQETERRKTEAEEVQDLMTAVPDLPRWQKDTPYLFARAQEVEQGILAGTVTLPEGTTLEALKKDDVARYNLVVSIVKREVGLPAGSPEKIDLQEKADKVIAGKTPGTPRSISDLAGGAPPASTEVDALEGMSGAEIGARFAKMTPEQQDAYLARIG